MTPIELALLTSGIGMVAGVAGKIGWDWLVSNRSKYDPGQPGRKCLDHETCIIGIAALKQSYETVKERLAKGDERMDGMAKDIGEIKTGVAVLLDRSE